MILSESRAKKRKWVTFGTRAKTVFFTPLTQISCWFCISSWYVFPLGKIKFNIRFIANKKSLWHSPLFTWSAILSLFECEPKAASYFPHKIHRELPISIPIHFTRQVIKYIWFMYINSPAYRKFTFLRCVLSKQRYLLGSWWWDVNS